MSEDYRAEVCWAIAYHSNSHSPRATRWYRIVRLAFVDGAWFELYWHNPTISLDNKAEVRRRAEEQGLTVRKGLFTTPRQNRHGNEMVQV